MFCSRWLYSVLVEQGGCIKPICDLLVSTDPVVVSTCLHALCNILLCGGNDYAARFDDKAEAIKKLESHDDRDVSNMARNIFRSWFDKTQQQQQRCSQPVLLPF